MTANGHLFWIYVHGATALLAAWMLACTDFVVFGGTVALGGFGLVLNIKRLLDKLGWPA